MILACIIAGVTVTAGSVFGWEAPVELPDFYTLEAEVCSGALCAWSQVAEVRCVDEVLEDGSVVRGCSGLWSSTSGQRIGWPVLRTLLPRDIPTRVRVRAWNAIGPSGPSNVLDVSCLPCYRTGPPWTTCP